MALALGFTMLVSGCAAAAHKRLVSQEEAQVRERASDDSAFLKDVFANEPDLAPDLALVTGSLGRD